MANFSSFWGRDQKTSGTKKPRIGFTDSTDVRVLEALARLKKTNDIQPLLIGPSERILKAISTNPMLKPDTSDILFPDTDSSQEKITKLLMEKQSKFNVNLDQAKMQVGDTLYQGIGHLLNEDIDGLISGSLRPTADVVKASLRCIGPKKGHKFVSGHFLIESEKAQTAESGPYLFADCAVVPEPSPRILSAIAKGAADSYHFFTGKTPRVALMSFSTRGSAEHQLVDRIRDTLNLLKKDNPSLIVDGEIQVDAAMDSEIAGIKKAGDSPIAGKANVFIFPTLESGNIGYKLVQRFSNARIAGPILWGLDKPVSDLSRGCTVQEIVDTAHCVSDLIMRMN